jgi:hypothetical protein
MKNITKLYSLIGIFLLPLAIYGCATILKGSIDQVDVSSDPNGAKIYVNGEFMGKTPVHLRLSAKKTFFIEFVKDGYEKKTYVLNSSVGAGWIVLDVVFGLIPVVVDASTGAWYEFDDNSARVYLEKVGGVTIEPSSVNPDIDIPKSSDKSGKAGFSIDDDAYVVSIVHGNPAYEAGIRAGDRIIKIDDYPIPVNDIIKTRSMLDGPPDTQVQVTVLRNSREFSFTLTRRKD